MERSIRLCVDQPREFLDESIREIEAEACDAAAPRASEKEARSLAAGPLADGREAPACVVRVEREDMHAHALEVGAGVRHAARASACAFASSQAIQPRSRITIVNTTGTSSSVR